jgi:hypothetical protein
VGIQLEQKEQEIGIEFWWGNFLESDYLEDPQEKGG